jgi:hypothetical protein
VSFYAHYEPYEQEELKFDQHVVPIPTFMFDNFTGFVDLIQRMTCRYSRIHISQIDGQLRKIEQDILQQRS